MDFAHAFFHENSMLDRSALQWRVRNTFLEFYAPDDDFESPPLKAGQNGKGLRRRSESVDTCRTGSTRTLGDTSANASTRTSSPTPPVSRPLNEIEFKPATAEIASRACVQANFSQSSNDGIGKGNINDTSSTTALGPVSTEEIANSNFTTAMIRNIACRYTTEDVKMLLDSTGFQSKYDYVRVPMKCTRSKTTSNLGYCFVNFTDPSYLLDFAEKFRGRRFGLGESQSKKRCDVSFAREQLSPATQLLGEIHRELKDQMMFTEIAESRRMKPVKQVWHDSKRMYGQNEFRNLR